MNLNWLVITTGMNIIDSYTLSEIVDKLEYINICKLYCIGNRRLNSIIKYDTVLIKSSTRRVTLNDDVKKLTVANTYKYKFRSECKYPEPILLLDVSLSSNLTHIILVNCIISRKFTSQSFS